jgi:BNR repeat-like domain
MPRAVLALVALLAVSVAITYSQSESTALPVVGDSKLLGYVGDCCGQDQSIAADPSNPARLVAASGADVWYSSDGGLNWEPGSLAPGVGMGDPSLGFDLEGRVYLGSVVGSGTQTALAVFNSDDGGKSWAMTRLTNWTVTTVWLNDKDWLGVDNSNSQFRGRIYVVWNVYVNGRWNAAHNNIVDAAYGGVYMSFSDTNGRTYSVPKRLSVDGKGLSALQVSVGPDGKVYLAGADWTSADGGDLELYVSRDGGNSFIRRPVIADFSSYPNPLRNTHVRTNLAPFPSLAVGPKGDVFLAWTSGSRIILASSKDEGSTWKKVVVNDDLQSKNDALMPSMTVSNGDVVHVA